MDKRASRNIMAHKNAIWFVLDDISNGLVLISKWDHDGSTGRSGYKQRSLKDASDNNIFITAIVPIQLYSTKTSGDKLILWQNPRPSDLLLFHLDTV